VTIHTDHPFATPEPDRDPVRRLRARLGGVVSLWTTGSAGHRSGLTVSSFIVVAGDPGHAAAAVDPESDFVRDIERNGVAVMQLLSWSHRQVADAFAGQFPAPGGVFTTAEWDETLWGPLLRGATSWAGVRLSQVDPRPIGWSLLLDTEIEHVEVADDPEPLVHRQGRYLRPG
jgi:flavin reductase (DIM6/NTAB) family NADH-FMN oxidoreductase RutF